MGAASGLAGRPIHLGIISRMTAFRTRLITALALAGAVVWTPGTPAQQTQRLLYAALPGVGGGNNLKYGVEHTLNPSLGPTSPHSFYAGQMTYDQLVGNADFSRDFDVGLAGPLNVAFGAEARNEQ